MKRFLKSAVIFLATFCVPAIAGADPAVQPLIPIYLEEANSVLLPGAAIILATIILGVGWTAIENHKVVKMIEEMQRKGEL